MKYKFLINYLIIFNFFSGTINSFANNKEVFIGHVKSHKLADDKYILKIETSIKINKKDILISKTNLFYDFIVRNSRLKNPGKFFETNIPFINKIGLYHS